MKYAAAVVLAFIVTALLALFVSFVAPAHAEVASWYYPGIDHVGHRTASGDYFTGNEMTAAQVAAVWDSRHAMPSRMCHREDQ
jgi:rare lipoprotein A (peptidoglycan hydrolase)